MVMVAPYVTSLQTRIYGADVRDYRPERWLVGGGGGKLPAAASTNSLHESDGQRELDQDAAHGQRTTAPSSAAAAAEGVGPADPLPFSEGPRDCVGRSLAMLELQAVVATLVGRFKFESDAKSADDLREHAAYHVTLQQEGGKMLLRATPRVAAA